MKSYKAGGRIMFKDKVNINHRNDVEYPINIIDLSNAISQDKSSKGFLKKYLLEDIVIEEKIHNPNHNFCNYKESDSDRITEKRICRCMHYYNNDAKNKKCTTCHFSAKWINKSDYEIIDYEVPMPTVVNKTGGIDLLLKSKIDGKFMLQK